MLILVGFAFLAFSHCVVAKYTFVDSKRLIFKNDNGEDIHYVFYYEHVTWPQAVERCKAVGAKLLEPENEKESRMVIGALKSFQNYPHIWTSFSDLNNTQIYKNMKGWYLNEKFDAKLLDMKKNGIWADYQPNTQEDSARCVTLNQDSLLEVHRCSALTEWISYVCKFPMTSERPGPIEDEFIDKLEWNGYYNFKIQEDNYVFFKTYDTSWHEARKRCRMISGQLWAPENEAEAKEVVKLLKRTFLAKKWPVWTGINDLNAKGVYRTLDGRPLREVYHRWHKLVEPGMFFDGWNCVPIQPDLSLSIQICEWSNPFVCKIPSPTAATADAAILKYCHDPDREWRFLCEKTFTIKIENVDVTYVFHGEVVTWEEARDSCEATGLKLLDLEFEDEAREVWQNIGHIANGNVWIGHNDLKTQGQDNHVVHTKDNLIYQFYPVSSDSMQFRVQAPNDAHIALTMGPQDSDPMIEIIIGGWGNTKSVIRRKNKPEIDELKTPGILNSDEFRGFWVRWSDDGLISVGREGESIPFLAWQDPEPFPVTFVGVCTGWGATGTWGIGPTLFQFRRTAFVRGPDRRCGAMHAARVYTNDCNTTLPYVCRSGLPQSALKPPTTDTFELPWGHKIAFTIRQSSYVYHKEKFTWQQAWERCSGAGAQLLAPEDEIEAQMVMKNVNRPGTNTYSIWTDITDLQYNETYRISDGRPISIVYNKWDKGQPNYVNGLNRCVLLNSNVLLNTYQCDYKFSYVCKFPDTLKEIPFHRHTMFAIQRNWYTFYIRNDTWYEARDRCSNAGAQLWAPADDEESAAVMAKMDGSIRYLYLWTAINDTSGIQKRTDKRPANYSCDPSSSACPWHCVVKQYTSLFIHLCDEHAVDKRPLAYICKLPALPAAYAPPFPYPNDVMSAHIEQLKEGDEKSFDITTDYSFIIYEYHFESVNWEEASNRCTAYKYELLTPVDEAEARRVRDLLDQVSPRVPIWIGIKDLDGWRRGDKPRWSANDPDMGGCVCVLLEPDLSMTVSSCKVLAAYVCKFEFIFHTATTTPRSGNTTTRRYVEPPYDRTFTLEPEGLDVSVDFLYQHFYDTFEQARNRCAAAGAHLSVPRDEEEAHAVMRAVRGVARKDFPIWTGIRNPHSSGLDPYKMNVTMFLQKLRSTEWDTKASHPCVLLGSDMFLTPASCTSRAPSVCELPKKKKTTKFETDHTEDISWKPDRSRDAVRLG